LVGLKYTLPILKLKMMKIKLLKNHVLGKQGDIVKVNYHRAKYLIAMGVALEQKQTNIEDEETTDKITDDGSNTKKRVTRKSKANAKP
jgi:hypothetical protein